MVRAVSCAVDRTADVAKALIVACYGRPPEYSYFIGSSNGARAVWAGAVAHVDYYAGIHRWVEQGLSRSNRRPSNPRSCAGWFARSALMPRGSLELRRSAIRKH